MKPGTENQGNSLMVTTERLTTLIGPALAGPVIVVAGLNWLFGFEAIGVVGAALLMLGLPDRPAGGSRGTGPDRRAVTKLRGIFAEGTATLTMLIRRDRMLLGLTITAFTYVAAVAFGQFFLTTYSLRHFPAISGGVGYLVAAMGAGGVAGAALAGRLSRFHQGRLYFWGNVLEGFCWLALPVTPLFAGSLGLMFLAGFFESVATVVYFAEAQRRLPQEYSGRFYGVFMPTCDVFVMLGTTIGAPALGAWGVGWAAVTICLLVAVPVIACAGIFLARDVPAGAMPPQPAVEEASAVQQSGVAG
jgi:MFS family permease